MRLILAAAMMIVMGGSATAQSVQQTKGDYQDKFRQLEEVLPTPNVYRTGSGAPGHAYWQQKVDYNIDVRLDEDKRQIHGSETVTYKNNSPDTLRYLWLQMDQNRFSKHSDAYATVDANSPKEGSVRRSFSSMRALNAQLTHDGGFKVANVAGKRGVALSYTIVDTMMRIDLATPLKSGDTTEFSINWYYNIPEGRVLGARGGFENYKRNNNDVFFISQWFPRLAAYTDSQGWEHKQFLGSGEFLLEFGDYNVNITVPSDHIVGSTGELQNAKDVLTATQRARMEEAKSSDRPVMIVNRDEALANEKEKASGTKTWTFKAKNVRDFAFASSRKFVWDAMGVKMKDSGRTVLAMSLFPEEAMPLWDKYSTQSIAHTLETYSKYSFEYPYPVAWSVKGPIGGGMEYPMITSNGPMPVDHGDGTRTYTKRAKYGLISVVIHEVGHIYFPMTVNTDERNWTWMDEGINSFLQSQSEREWQADYPGRRIHPKAAIPYMVSQNQVPIMTQSDSVVGFGANSYTKPAVALSILRETVVGREGFDFAFREYARRWKFKRPYPADFFRSLEDASGRDLDWFFRGWFYTTDHVDIALTGVQHAVITDGNPAVESQHKRKLAEDSNLYIGEMRNQASGLPLRVDRFPELLDFYNETDDHVPTPAAIKRYARMTEGLEAWQKDLLKFGNNIYYVDFENLGGLVMPLVLDVTYADGTSEIIRTPAEIWRRNARQVTKMIVSEKEITSIVLDPYHEIADADHSNNAWPAKAKQTRLELFESKPSTSTRMRSFDVSAMGEKEKPAKKD